MRFQRKIHESLQDFAHLGDLKAEPWYRFSDTYGTHCCSPDSILITHDRVLVVESKLSLRRIADAQTQLYKLYKPCLEHLYRKPVAMLLAFRFWMPGKGENLQMVDSPAELLYQPTSQLKEIYGWHQL